MVAKAKSANLTPAEAEDRERLLVEAAQRDPTRFGELYEEHFGRVYAYIIRRVADRHDAEDLTADVFHKALANVQRFEWRGVPFAAWLLRIAANAIADWTKRSAREGDVPDGGEPDEQPPVESTEHLAHLYRLVDQLPADQRRVVEMRFAEDKSIREIAQELGRSEGAVKQLQFRALEKLRAQMGESNG
jgi:RNA polymerase sigma-70 factor, ECF subfamily